MSMVQQRRVWVHLSQCHVLLDGDLTVRRLLDDVFDDVCAGGSALVVGVRVQRPASNASVVALSFLKPVGGRSDPRVDAHVRRLPWCDPVTGHPSPAVSPSTLSAPPSPGRTSRRGVEVLTPKSPSRAALTSRCTGKRLTINAKLR